MSKCINAKKTNGLKSTLHEVVFRCNLISARIIRDVPVCCPVIVVIVDDGNGKVEIINIFECVACLIQCHAPMHCKQKENPSIIDVPLVWRNANLRLGFVFMISCFMMALTVKDWTVRYIWIGRNIKK